MKTLVLSYELAWRTPEDQKFMKTKIWKDIRHKILERDNYTCQYCGVKRKEFMQINHVSGNPKDHSDANLEVICSSCHMITHSGLWCAVFKTIDVYEKSKYHQNEIIRITGKMRDEGKTDEEIIEVLGLKNKIPWKQDLDYLSTKYGFITSRKADKTGSRVFLTEDEQKKSLQNRENW
jgi:hypothetical protein